MNSSKVPLAPQRFFENPMDVVTSIDLSKPEKLEALLQWERDTIQLQQATGEGMSGGEEARLADVREALRFLREPV